MGIPVPGKERHGQGHTSGHGRGNRDETLEEVSLPRWPSVTVSTSLCSASGPHPIAEPLLTPLRWIQKLGLSKRQGACPRLRTGGGSRQDIP